MVEHLRVVVCHRFESYNSRQTLKKEGMIAVAKFHIARTFVDVPFYVSVHAHSGITLTLLTTNGEEFYSKPMRKCSKDEMNKTIDDLKAYVYQHPYDTREALVALTEAFFIERSKANKKHDKQEMSAA